MARPKKIDSTLSSPETEVVTVPLSRPSRREDGLLSNINYKFDQYGFVDWKDMIPNDEVSLNREAFLKKSTPIDVDSLKQEEIEELKLKASDHEKVIKIGGYKHLAFIRGYSSVETKVDYYGDKCVAVCTITWVPNFESNFRPVITTGLADASPENTNVLSTKYLTAIAENRAFCRCVRNYLRINILGKDEMKFDMTDAVGEQMDIPAKTLTGPLAFLNKRLKDKKKSFADFQQYILSNFSQSDFPGADTWEGIKDIPIDQANTLLEEVGNFLSSK